MHTRSQPMFVRRFGPIRSEIHVRLSIAGLVLVCCLAGLVVGQEAEKQNSPSRENDSPQKKDGRMAPVVGASEKVKEQKSDAKPPAEPSQLPVERELERTPEGEIRFSFQRQPWLAVLQWLSDSSGLTLDWQELPDGVLNLTTKQSYTLDEARDLFNMHLAARGFTLLRRGEVLTLTKLDKLNPALVPRVEAEDLAERDSHEIVRVSFPLDWLVAEQAAKEFAPMLSPFGKLMPMEATNRLEAMDTVDNLSELRAVLAHEQSRHGESRLVVEFKLKHVRADEIIVKLRELVGEQATRGLAANRNRSSDQMRRELERAREQAENNKPQGGEQRRPVRSTPDVHLVVNNQENSILANAPPDKIALIRQAVQALDVALSDGARLRENVTRMRIYRTKSLDPESIEDMVANLIEMGKLQSTTKVQADDDSNMLIVYATPADHMAIANLVSQIEEDGRDVRIIKLGGLDPHYALQAIKLLLQGNSSASSGRRRGGGGDDEQFRIEADFERGRLLAWVNDTEYDEIKEFLAKLGDEQDSVARRGGIRVLNFSGHGAAGGRKRGADLAASPRQSPPRAKPGKIRDQDSRARDPARRSSIELPKSNDAPTTENKTASPVRSPVTNVVRIAAATKASEPADATTPDPSADAEEAEIDAAEEAQSAADGDASPETPRLDSNADDPPANSAPSLPANLTTS